MAKVIDHELLESTFTKYFAHLAAREHDKAIDYVYPPLFRIIPKKAVLSIMKQGDQSVDIRLTNLLIEKISRPKTERGITYVVLRYRYTLTMVFPEPQTDPEEDDDELTGEKENDTLAFSFEILKEKYGRKNVVADREHSTLTANVDSQVYCISDPAYTEWKFLEKKKGMEELFEKLLKGNKP